MCDYGPLTVDQLLANGGGGSVVYFNDDFIADYIIYDSLSLIM